MRVTTIGFWPYALAMESGGPSERNRGAKAARVLYITYDGLTDPLGQSQVLPYLTELSRCGHEITILSCEKRAAMDKEGDAIRKLCDSNGLDWQPLPYHKSPPILSSALDLARLRRTAARLNRTRTFDLVHCRSYLPALVGLAMKRRRGTRLLFDMRGFWADERVEGGLWDLRNPLFRAVFRYFKRREAELLRESDHIISLTEAGRAVLLDRADSAALHTPISVIPCCVDFKAFPPTDGRRRAEARRQLAIAVNCRVATYLGSIGTWYLLDEMLDLFRVQLQREPDALFLFVTRDRPEPILAAAEAKGITAHSILIRGASRQEVPSFVAAADYGISFIKPVSSKIASCPTKLGEMLALEIPVVTNGGVGDVAQTIEETGGGVVVKRFDEAAYAEALDRLERLDGDGGHWRELARRRFDLEQGIDRYNSIYRSIIRTGAPTGDLTKQGN